MNDKNSVLTFWIYHYGLTYYKLGASENITDRMYMLKLNRFKDLYNFALASYADGLSNQLLVSAIKDDKENEFLDDFVVKFNQFLQNHPGVYEIMDEVFLDSMHDLMASKTLPIDLAMLYDTRKGR